jgi:AraC-like DNA-binding protein
MTYRDTGTKVKRFILKLGLPSKVNFAVFGIPDPALMSDWDTTSTSLAEKNEGETTYSVGEEPVRTMTDVSEKIGYGPRPQRFSVDEIDSAVKKWTFEHPLPDQDMKIDDLAATLGVSLRQLRAYFQSFLNMDFRTWKTSRRIDVAKRLLLDDQGMSINQIASYLGFKDRSNFYRQFKYRVGCTPKYWQDCGGNLSAEEEKGRN